MTKTIKGIEKIKTGISGFDELSEGGLPKGRVTLVSGTAGSGKTVFGLEFLYRGITRFGEKGTFVTFEERPADLTKEAAGFGWNLSKCIRRGDLSFVDASAVAEHQVEVGEYDFGALIARIKYAVEKVGAKRVVIDSMAALFLRYKNQSLLRRELFKIFDMLRKMGVTSVITAERIRDEDTHSRFGIEDFVADSVIFLYHTPVGRGRERQIEVVKLRGASHQTGRQPFQIGEDGLIIFPAGRHGSAAKSSTSKISTGVSGIDAMTDGGVFRGSTSLLLGGSGTGRTVLGLQFIWEGVRKKERCLLISFEESDTQLRTDAASFGWDFDQAERRGLLKIAAWHPEILPLESYQRKIEELVKEFRPRRIVVDSVTPLANSVDEDRFRKFIVSLNSYLKDKAVTTFVNYTTIASIASSLAAESDMAMVADNIFVLRFVESQGKMDREILIAKSRASSHDKEVRRYIIDACGMTVLSGASSTCESQGFVEAIKKAKAGKTKAKGGRSRAKGRRKEKR